MRLSVRLVSAFVIVAVVTAFTGGIGVHFTNEMGRDGHNVGDDLAPLADAAMEIKLTATTAHLQFEEIMAGDSAENVEDVWALLDETLWYCDAIAKGGTNDEGEFHASTDPAVQETIAEVRSSVANFIKSAHERYNILSGSSGVGSDADEQFDQSYESILSQLDTIIQAHTENKDTYQAAILAGHVKFILADSHLFFEEHLSGDESARFEDVVNGITQASDTVRQIGVLIGDQKTRPIEESIGNFLASAQQREDNHVKLAGKAEEVDASFDAEFEAFVALADEAEERIHDSIDNGLAKLDQDNEKARILLAGVTILSFVLAIGLGLYMSRSIINSFKTIFMGLKTFSKSELKETGATFNRIIDGLYDSGTQMAENVTMVSSASDRLAGSASTQASSLEETASSLEEMAAMTRSTAANSKEASEISSQSQQAAQQGQTTITQINESADQMSSIIKVIEEIAFQTNLLALNAAVEAARAGEHGKGFAVVADEVRGLAQRAAEAAGQTTQLIEVSCTRAREGSAAMESIVSGVSQVTELLNNITQAAQEQAQGVEQINIAVAEMDKLTQQNAAAAEETATSSQEIASQAESVRTMVDEVLVIVRGSADHSGTMSSYCAPTASAASTTTFGSAMPDASAKSESSVSEPETVSVTASEDEAWKVAEEEFQVDDKNLHHF